eukprot:1161743-Pelagomonas_calceolata.AAC.8
MHTAIHPSIHPVLHASPPLAEDSTTPARSTRPSLSPYHHPQLASPQQPTAAVGTGPSQVMQFEPSLQYEDVWVTVYGFTQVGVYSELCCVDTPV